MHEADACIVTADIEQRLCAQSQRARQACSWC